MSIQLKVNKVGGGDAKLAVSDIAFGKEFNQPLVHQVVVAYQAGGRAGSRAQKNRAAVSGGGAKPWRQKGTGRARAGTIRSPLFRGGGVAFPAANKDFSQKVNRQMYRAALRSILSELNRQKRLIVIDELKISKPNTKNLAAILTTIGATALARQTTKRALLVVEKNAKEIELSARNLSAVSVCASAQIDPYNLIAHDKIVATVDAIKKIDIALQ